MLRTIEHKHEKQIYLTRNTIATNHIPKIIGLFNGKKSVAALRGVHNGLL